MKTDLEKYKQNLFQISKRMEVVADHLSGITNTKYLITEVEFLCLQFRKILELIALSSLVANKDEYSKHYKKFANHYNARLILQDLERINPKFYPVPTKQIIKNINGKNVFELKAITHGYLTKEEFLEIFEKCGGMLHSENPYGKKRDIKKIKDEFSKWYNKIRILLNHHNIELIDDETMIIGLMKGENGLPHVAELKVIKNLKPDDILNPSK